MQQFWSFLCRLFKPCLCQTRTPTSMGPYRRTAHRNVDVKTLFIVISRNFWRICFHFPFLSGKWFCIVFHFGTEKMIFQINYKGWRSGFGKALSNELIIFSFSNHITIWFLNILITKWLITFLPSERRIWIYRIVYLGARLFKTFWWILLPIQILLNLSPSHQTSPQSHRWYTLYNLFLQNHRKH